MKVTETQLIIDAGNGEVVPAQVTEDGGRAVLDNAATIVRMARSGVPIRTVIKFGPDPDDEVAMDRTYFPGQQPSEDDEAVERVSPEEAKEVLEEVGEPDVDVQVIDPEEGDDG